MIYGILGGMGPQASCELYNLINFKSAFEYEAKQNADFCHLLISSLPVPDLIESKEDELVTINMVQEEAKRLDNADVTDLFMACNTMHLFADQLFEGLNCRFHSLINLVIEKLKRDNCKSVFVPATKTTIQMGLYEDVIKRAGIRYHRPSENLMDACVVSIKQTISGQFVDSDRQKFFDLIDLEFAKSGADTMLLACTELPLIFKDRDINYTFVSSLEVLAEKICELNFGKESSECSS